MTGQAAQDRAQAVSLLEDDARRLVQSFFGHEPEEAEQDKRAALRRIPGQFVGTVGSGG